jgi:phosphoglycolate phosphatase-like HAD superfamily hydrolase
MGAVVVLDFDGVLCDSAHETAASAWRAGTAIWPHWQGEVSTAYAERFSQVRPWLETGYQAILMLRMVDLGCSDNDFAEHLGEWETRILSDCGMDRARFVARFGESRDRWIETDLEGWLGANRFFPGTVALMKEGLDGGGELYIATTKQERFTKALLAAEGVELPDDRLYGFERGISKEQLLADLQQREPEATLHFVEDRLETLRRVEACPELDNVKLYLALWGYCTPGDRMAVTADARITAWELEDFLWKRG